MSESERTALVNEIAAELRNRGHAPSVDGSHLTSVDGTWVGLWVMPKNGKKSEGKPVVRIGFADNNTSLDPDSGAVRLADSVLDWLDAYGEASRRRSATPLKD